MQMDYYVLDSRCLGSLPMHGGLINILILLMFTLKGPFPVDMNMEHEYSAVWYSLQP